MTIDPREAYARRAEQAARDWARADPSDPFAYARARNDYDTGLANPTRTYEVQFRSETRKLAGADGRILTYTVEVPHSMKRP